MVGVVEFMAWAVPIVGAAYLIDRAVRDFPEEQEAAIVFKQRFPRADWLAVDRLMRETARRLNRKAIVSPDTVAEDYAQIVDDIVRRENPLMYGTMAYIALIRETPAFTLLSPRAAERFWSQRRGEVVPAFAAEFSWREDRAAGRRWWTIFTR